MKLLIKGVYSILDNLWEVLFLSNKRGELRKQLISKDYVEKK
jgi:hypothetical protein